MYKRTLSTFIILVFLCASLPQPIKGYSATAPPPQIGDILKKAKKKAEEAAGKVKARLDTKKAANEAIAAALSNALNDELPLKHDVNSVFRPVYIPEEGFRPKRLTLAAKNLDERLPPGDYEIPVTVYCTKGNVSVPGKGVGFALAYMQGKQANAMAMLYLRGAIQGVDRSTIQIISWSIQAATPYGEMPREHQQIIDRLIPEYRRQLEGDFLQSFEYKYNTLTRAAKGPGIPSFDQVMNRAGIFGVRVADIKREREIIRANAFNYQLLEQRLTSGTIEVNEKAPWGEVRPGVYARLVMNGFQGLNWLQFRYAPGQRIALSQSPFRPVAFMHASQAQTIVITVIEVLYGLGVRVVIRRVGRQIIIESLLDTIKALMGIPIAQHTQSLAISPMINVGSEGGEADEEPEISFQSEHGGRHLKGTGLTPSEVEAVIKEDITRSLRNGTLNGNAFRRITIRNVVIEYRPFRLSTGSINVGTYYPVQ